MCNDHRKCGRRLRIEIWFGSVVRGDNEPIVIGERINIKDGCILHSDPGSPLRIENDTTVGHRAVVHGCTIGTASVADRPRLDATTACAGK